MKFITVKKHFFPTLQNISRSFAFDFSLLFYVLLVYKLEVIQVIPKLQKCSKSEP